MQVSFTALGARSALLLGKAAQAWELTRMLFEYYDRDRGASRRPVHAVVSTIVMIDRWPSATPRERRRMRKALRTCRATARQWVPRCPESYQSMLELVQAEIASIEGRHEDAMATYERAWSLASEQALLWLAGLASERLARLARRRGQTILAEGAFDAARESCEAWGATAVVLRLDRDRAAGR